ncbi:MAG: glutamate-1-semialdehyde 2,1-aminomutase [Planctomycetes bacterium]|nr:glutamate-1-semialdehyde 2,1-aminomutase [Planctomycetota bacterium]
MTRAGRYTRSEEAFARARRVLAGGVNSPVRAFKAVGGTPVFFARGKGSRLVDVDDHQYVDYVGSWGPLILGHAPARVIERLMVAAAGGTSFGAPTTAETELAELIAQALPAVESLRFVNSGTEAVMSALRLARAFTGRPLIFKFAGCYHGHCDALLVAGGSGMATLGAPSSPGVTEGAARDTIVLPYNNLDAVAAALQRDGARAAAVIVEPVAGNMGVVPPAPGFLQGLRDICSRHGALLIFDEVMTGFRVAYGGAQTLYGVTPDLTTLGKIIGGGLPVGAYGGRREIMALVSPEGAVYQAGTLSGNPVAMAAGIETLRLLHGLGVYEQLERASSSLAACLEEAARQAGVAAVVNRVGSMLTLFFLAAGRPARVENWEDASRADTAAYARFFRAMLDRGVYLPPGQYEALFVSAAHDEEDLALTAAAAREAMRAARGSSPGGHVPL